MIPLYPNYFFYSQVNHNDSIPDNSVDNPLVEQMNIIRGYIKEAREKMEFEEVCWSYFRSGASRPNINIVMHFWLQVAILEQNLRELKQEYHNQMTRSAQ